MALMYFCLTCNIRLFTHKIIIFWSVKIFFIYLFIFILQQHFISYLQTKEKLQKL